MESIFIRADKAIAWLYRCHIILRVLVSAGLIVIGIVGLIAPIMPGWCFFLPVIALVNKKWYYEIRTKLLS